MLVEYVFVCLEQLESDQLEALVLEAGDDPSDEAALHPVRLDHDVGSLLLVRHVDDVLLEQSEANDGRAHQWKASTELFRPMG